MTYSVINPDTNSTVTEFDCPERAARFVSGTHFEIVSTPTL